MKKITIALHFFLGSLLCPFIFALSSPSFSKSFQVEKLTSASQKTFHLFGKKSKKVKVVFLWASWCQYCKQFAQDIYKITQANENIFDFIGLCVDETKSDGQKVAVNTFRNIKKMYWVPKEVAKQMSLNQLPSVIIVDKAGEIDTIYEGAQSDKVTYLKKRLKELEPKAGDNLDKI